MNRPVRRALLLAGALFAGVLPATAKEGFSLMTKKVASVVRVSPPAVFLMGPKIQVTVSRAGAGEESLAERVKSQLESELIGRDSRLIVEPNRPETSIEVSILQNDHSERWETREETELVKVGKDSKGKPIYESRKVNVRYKVVTHGFAASYKVTDQRKALSLDADSLRFDYSEDFRDGEGAPEIFSLESSAVGKLVDAIARRITPTRETIGVLIPKGSLEDLANLAIAGQWNLYLEALERRTPNPKPLDESYRQYALGVAYEALGYAADDPAETLRYLEQASIYYNKALETNPGEKFFARAYDSLLTSKSAAAPLERVQTALANYRKISDFQQRYASLKAQEQENLAGGKALGSEADRMDNAAVIRMVRAGLPDDVILTAIDTAAQPEFDASPQGLIALSEAQVDKKIIQRLQQVATREKTDPAKAPVKNKPATGKPSGKPVH